MFKIITKNQTSPVAVFTQVLPDRVNNELLCLLTVELDLEKLEVSASLIPLQSDDRTDYVVWDWYPVEFAPKGQLTLLGQALQQRLSYGYTLGDLDPALNFLIYGFESHPLYFQAENLYASKLATAPVNDEGESVDEDIYCLCRHEYTDPLEDQFYPTLSLLYTGEELLVQVGIDNEPLETIYCNVHQTFEITENTNFCAGCQEDLLADEFYMLKSLPALVFANTVPPEDSNIH